MSCQWCGDPLTPGSGDWGRAQGRPRYKSRPARFCGQSCAYRMWQLEKGKLTPEQAALRRLQLLHREEFGRLLAEEQGRRAVRPS